MELFEALVCTVLCAHLALAWVNLSLWVMTASMASCSCAWLQLGSLLTPAGDLSPAAAGQLDPLLLTWQLCTWLGRESRVLRRKVSGLAS